MSGSPYVPQGAVGLRNGHSCQAAFLPGLVSAFLWGLCIAHEGAPKGSPTCIMHIYVTAKSEECAYKAFPTDRLAYLTVIKYLSGAREYSTWK